MYKSIIVIGPGKKNIYQKLQKLRNDSEVIIIGDGTKAISHESFLPLKGSISLHSRIDIVIHGVAPRDTPHFSLWTGGSTLLMTASSLFNSITSVNPGVALNIHLWSCYGDLAHQDFNILPPGSFLMSYSTETSAAPGVLADFMLIKALEHRSIISCYDLLSHIFLSYYSDGIKKLPFSPDIQRVINNPQTALEQQIELLAPDFPCLAEYEITTTLVMHYLISQVISACEFCPDILLAVLRDPSNKYVIPLLTTESLEGFSLLHSACAYGRYEVAKLLLDSKDNPNKEMIDGELVLTPLCFVCSKKPINEELFYLLVLYGASISIKVDREGNSLLHNMVICENVKGAELLLNSQIDPDIHRNDKTTALILAAQDGAVEIATMLLNAGADVNAQNDRLITPLITAVEQGHTNMVRLLVDHGANCELAASDGATPYTIALNKRDTESINMLCGSVLPYFYEEL